MMRYYKLIDNTFISAVGTGDGGMEIPETEYNEILALIRNKPRAECGFDYRLKTDLTWELCECPYLPDEDADAADYEEALGRFGV